MGHIRTFAELEALPPTPAEWYLINAAQAGEPCVLGDGTLPAEGSPHPDRQIRAEVLRYLILGGCAEYSVDDVGVWLCGGHISENLDLNFTTVRGALGLRNCRLESNLDMAQTKCKMLDLNGSAINGLSAQGLEVRGTVFLRRVSSTTTIELIGAKIGGQLSCIGAQLSTEDGFALSVQSALIDGGIYLQPRAKAHEQDVTQHFSARGGIILAGATISCLYAKKTTFIASPGCDAFNASGLTVTGNVRMDDCKVQGETKFSGAKIIGHLSCKGASFDNPGGNALIARRMQVAQSFIWRKEVQTSGHVILDGAHVAELDDNPRSWPDAAHLSLDGFTYDRIAEYTKYDDARKKWLRDGSIAGDQFFPQPYTQYAKFLRDTGHDAQARKVMLTRERMVRCFERKEFSVLLRAWRWFWDGLQLVVVGHGHAPFWSIGWLAFLIFLATIPAHLAWEEGSFAPNSGPVLVSTDWQSLQATEAKPAQVWAGDLPPAGWTPPSADTDWPSLAPGRDWETFNRYAYAADVVIPLINFGQTEAWAPSTTRGAWGWHLWWARWVFTVFGWIVTALGAAAITGIIRRD